MDSSVRSVQMQSKTKILVSECGSVDVYWDMRTGWQELQRKLTQPISITQMTSKLHRSWLQLLLQLWLNQVRLICQSNPDTVMLSFVDIIMLIIGSCE